MTEDCVVHVIPERFSFDEDTSLKVFLREHRSQSVAINALNLRRVDSLFVQYLIAASRVWRAAGLDFRLTDVPQEVGNTLTLLGLDDQTLCWKVAA